MLCTLTGGVVPPTGLGGVEGSGDITRGQGGLDAHLLTGRGVGGGRSLQAKQDSHLIHFIMSDVILNSSKTSTMIFTNYSCKY